MEEEHSTHEGEEYDKENADKEEVVEEEEGKTRSAKKKRKAKKSKASTHPPFIVPDEHKEKVEQLQENLKASDYAQYHTDVGQMYRFLVARDFNVKKAYEMALKYYEWWESFRPHEIPVSDIEGELKTGKFIILGHDKLGRTCCLFRGCRHIPGEFSIDTTWKTVHFLMQRAIRKCKPGQHQLLLMFEQHGMGWKNFDRRLTGIGQILEAYYPERVGKIIIMDPDWLFWCCWKIAKPLMPTATANKVIPLSGDPTEKLLELIDHDQLWSRYGGSWKASKKRREMFGITDDDEKYIWERKR